MNGHIHARYSMLGSAATSAIVALGLVAAPPIRYESEVLRPEFAAVQLQAVAAPIADAVAHSASYAATAATDPVAFVSAAGTAAATTPIDDLLTLVRTAIGAVLSPILLPIGALATTLAFACQGGNINGLVCAAATFVVNVVSFFYPSGSPAAATPTTRRSRAAAATAESTVSATSQAAPAGSAPTAKTTRNASRNGRATHTAPRTTIPSAGAAGRSAGAKAARSTGSPRQRVSSR